MTAPPLLVACRTLRLNEPSHTRLTAAHCELRTAHLFLCLLLSIGKPLGHVSEEDLVQAKHAISTFAVVIILERLKDRDTIQLSKLLGWKQTGRSEPATVTSANATIEAMNTKGLANTTTAMLGDGLRATLMRINKFDYELYRFADTLAASISAKCVRL